MLSLEKCREILQKHGNNYTKEEIEEIRAFLGSLCELEYEILKSREKEEGHHCILLTISEKYVKKKVSK